MPSCTAIVFDGHHRHAGGPFLIAYVDRSDTWFMALSIAQELYQYLIRQKIVHQSYHPDLLCCFPEHNGQWQVMTGRHIATKRPWITAPEIFEEMRLAFQNLQANDLTSQDTTETLHRATLHYETREDLEITSLDNPQRSELPTLCPAFEAYWQQLHEKKSQVQVEGLFTLVPLLGN